MGIKITSLSYALPQNKITHDELCERFGKDVMDKVATASGIWERRAVSPEQCASDLAVEAANKILSEDDRKSVDMLIFATQTPDYLLPTTACILQDRLGLNKEIPAFDINLGCTQFLFALSTAKAYIAARMAKKVLVLCADTPTKLINPKDKSAIALFSDAASACIIEQSEEDCALDFVFGSDGSGYTDLICPTSGLRNPPTPADFIEMEDENQNIRANVNLHINGLKIFAFAFKIIPQTVEKLLARNNLTKDDIDLYIFHQAGKKIVEASAKRAELDMNKVYLNMRDIGNCGGSSVAIALADAIKNGQIKSGSKVLLCAFGVGLSWSGAIIKMPEILPEVK